MHPRSEAAKRWLADGASNASSVRGAGDAAPSALRRLQLMLATRNGRRTAKLAVVACGLVWCSSVPALLVGPQSRGETLSEAAEPTARKAEALAALPDVDLGTVSTDEAAARVRALLTRRGPGDVEHARDLIERALANPPAERARRRLLERLRVAVRHVLNEESTLCRLAQVEPDAAQADRPGPKPVRAIR